MTSIAPATLDAAPNPERESCWTHDYLLHHCEGYRVFFGASSLGYVDTVVLAPDGDVQALVVGNGGRFNYRLVVPADAVESLCPQSERLVVSRVRGLPAGAQLTLRPPL